MRVEVPASWFKVIWYGSVAIQWDSGHVYLLEIRYNVHISSEIDCFQITHSTQRHTTVLILLAHFPSSLSLCL